MKQKHWQVSVFDKTSETIKNDTFYTTDTEAFLIFELIDEDFTPDSATVTVYNVNGKATINVNVEVVDGMVHYEIPEEAIGHPGGWRTQMIFTKDGEDYTTSIIVFEVRGHLLDNNKPRLVAIANWNRFIKHAENLIDDWEHLEELRQSNEQQRELAEATRQNEFETNETSRQENELVRLASEVDRVNAENVRSEFYEWFESEISNIKTEIEKKADKQQEAWITPTLLNGWEHRLDSNKLQYRKNEFGRVEFRGAVKSGVIGQVVFTLPSGYVKTPPSTMTFQALTHDRSNAEINIGGSVTISKASTNVWVSFEQVSYYIE